MEFLILAITLVCLVMSSVSERCTSPTIPPELCSCENQSDNTKLLDCRNKNLMAIPNFTLTTDIVFDLLLTGYPTSNNRITTIDAFAFQNISVRKIDLLGNTIHLVHENAFKNSANITEILIEGTNNKSAPSDALNAVKSLTKLHLKNFQQTTISPGQLAFPNLNTLILENFTGLSALDADAFVPLQNLQEFQIISSTGTWSSLPVTALYNLMNLKLLKLQDLKLSETTIYTSSFNALSKLETLYIVGIQNLKKIDNGAFGNASKSLTHLYIRYTDITDLNFLPAEQWPSLEHLDLSFNIKIGSIIRTSNFSTLTALRVLLLQDTTLSSVYNGTFVELRNLHTLDLGYNKISTIGAQAFSSMPNLTDLRLTDQKVTIDINANAFMGIENSLQSLLLDNNTFNYSTFWTILPSLTQLIELDLKSTSLTSLPDYAFRYNTKLKELKLENNNLTSVKQQSFYGPRALKQVYLGGNLLTTLDACVFSDFPTKPTFSIIKNKLHCDCELAWLLQWITQHSDKIFVEVYVGPCFSPSNFSGKLLATDIKEAELCPGGGGTVPQCPDLYTTTTSTASTTTTPRKPGSTTTLRPPIPHFQLVLNHIDYTNIDLTWTVQDKTDVTGFQLKMVTNYQGTIIKDIAPTEQQYRFYDLQSGENYFICLHLKINNLLIDSPKSCIPASTLHPVTPSTSSPSTAEPESQNQLPVIIGTSVGGVVLVVILILIIYVLLNAKKQKKPPPQTTAVSFTMHPHATIPQAGGTAKRFAKKADKEGATPDDISVTVISNGEMVNRDRISAGSYQFLNEKGIDNRPMPSTGPRLPQTDHYNRPVQSNGAHSPGEKDNYMNNFDQRPLPRAPGGARGYVNTGNKSSKELLPETSKSEYSEVRY